jgi:hypothetical protein
MALTPQSFNRTGGRTPPGIEIRPAEEQLAASARLLGGDRPLGREPSDAVATDAEVFSCAPGVEPLVSMLLSRRRETRRDTLGNQLRESPDQIVERLGGRI